VSARRLIFFPRNYFKRRTNKHPLAIDARASVLRSGLALKITSRRRLKTTRVYVFADIASSSRAGFCFFSRAFSEVARQEVVHDAFRQCFRIFVRLYTLSLADIPLMQRCSLPCMFSLCRYSKHFRREKRGSATVGDGNESPRGGADEREGGRGRGY